MSSTHCERCGKSVDTHAPAWPYCLKVQGEARIGVEPSVNWLWTLPKLSGSFWPSYFFSPGFGSNVSIWLGAPTMNRKMTDFALPGKCDDFAARTFSRGFA